jgi:hypothetical protein
MDKLISVLFLISASAAFAQKAVTLNLRAAAAAMRRASI